ncbi:unnamed protein product [Amoebophrya sp. A25]|nr:unnamed protein product [Amoebophrya sp. A25]|eukprot:GSA25T00019683001.1
MSIASPSKTLLGSASTGSDMISRPPPPHTLTQAQLNEQEMVTSLGQVFSRYDSRNDGTVDLGDIPNLLVDLGRDVSRAAEVVKYLRELGGTRAGTRGLPPVSARGPGPSSSASSKQAPMSARGPNITRMANRSGIDEVVAALRHVEMSGGSSSSSSGGHFQNSYNDYKNTTSTNAIEKMTTPLALMRRLEQYRKQCETKGDYGEAKKSRAKYEELRSKEVIRQRRLIEQAQVHEISEVESAQKQQCLEFSAAWDRYMADYESTAYMSLEKLKEQHALQFQELNDQLERQPRVCKFSPDLLELRRKQKVLGKQGLYEEASKVKEQADRMEKWEIAKFASTSVDQVQKLEQRLRAQQNKALNALLKRIQRDRGEQIRQRSVDSRRLCQRNKNLRSDLEKRQHFEYIRADAAIKAILANAEHAEKLTANVEDAGFLEKLGVQVDGTGAIEGSKGASKSTLR